MCTWYHEYIDMSVYNSTLVMVIYFHWRLGMLMLLVMLVPKHLCIIFESDIYNAPVEYIWCDIYQFNVPSSAWS